MNSSEWTNITSASMGTSDWINIATASILFLTIVVSLIIGLKSLQQTKNIQKQQYTQLLLDEIIQWAISIVKCESEIKVAELTDAYYNERVPTFKHVMAWQKYQTTNAKSEYIEIIASEFGGVLFHNVKETKELLGEHITMLGEYIEHRRQFNILDEFDMTDNARLTIDKLRQKWQSLVKSAVSLVSETTKIKIKV